MDHISRSALCCPRRIAGACTMRGDWCLKRISSGCLRAFMHKNLPCFIPTYAGRMVRKHLMPCFSERKSLLCLSTKGFLRQDARYSSDVTAFMADLDLKISEGCLQLARDIGALFPEEGVGRTLREVPVPTDAFCVLPVLIVQDSILKSPFVNYFLNKRFQLERERFRTKSQVKILPLNVIQITQLESLIEMAETFGLDVISTLHRRCNMDEVMGVDLQDFITQTIPESKQMRCSKRFDEMMQKSVAEMRQILFGPDTQC